MLRRAVLFTLATLLLAPAAVAQNNRSAVSVNGSDAASCTVADPCRTFAVALSRTNPNGDVVALTSGGYGPFIIDKAVTVAAAPGIYAAILATTGDAIQINAGTGAKVVIRGLHLYGVGTEAGIEVSGLSDEVHVEHCVVAGFQVQIIAYHQVHISDTTIHARGGKGIDIVNYDGGVAKATIDRVEVSDCGVGIQANLNANVTVRDSVAADCSTGFWAQPGQLNIENSLATGNSFAGVLAESGGTIRVSNTMATDNLTGFRNLGSTFVSWGNNKVQGNTTDKSGTITVVTQN